MRSGAVWGCAGEVLSFQDGGRYGRVHGGVYLQDRPSTEADMPLAYADTGNPAPGAFADGAGKFAGNTAKGALAGRYAKVTDYCGTLANPTSNKIYQNIGYEPVCDVDEYKFG